MPDIRHAITIDASIDRVAPLVSSPKGLAAWWAEDVEALPDSAAVELGFFDRATTYRLVPTPDSKSIRWRCETGQEWARTNLVRREAGTRRSNSRMRLGPRPRRTSSRATRSGAT